MPDPITGAGAKFKVGDGQSPEVFTALAQVKTVDYGGETQGQIDFTNLDSPADAQGRIWKQVLGGIVEGGDVTINANYIVGDTSQAAIQSYRDGANHNYQVVLPPDPDTGDPVETWSFTGMITGFKKSISLTEALGFSLTIKMSGPDSVS